MRKHHRPGHPAGFQNRLLTEIQAEDLRILCNKVKERGAPATAVQIRDIVKQVYVFAIAHGEKVVNPADSVGRPRSPPSCRRIVPCRRWRSG
jgi:site-specific recombinase XerC